MSTTTPSPGSDSPTVREFQSTRWTMVLRASRRDDPGAQTALAELCRIYWAPVYSFIRRRGNSPTDSEDFTQEFFARLLEHNYLEGVQQEGGKFRSYLLTMVKRFLANEWEKQGAQKRGGGTPIVSLDALESEELIASAQSESPELAFERRWAKALLDGVEVLLLSEYSRTGKRALFEAIRPLLSGSAADETYARIASRLSLSEGAIKIAVHRLRKRYGELLRERIADTVESPGQVDEELRHLIQISARENSL